MESSCDVGGPKYPWTVVNRKMKSIRVGLSPRCHRMVELDDDSRVIELTQNHERLQMISLHEERGISEPWVCAKCREVVVNLTMEIPLPAADIPRDGIAREVRPPDDRCRR